MKKYVILLTACINPGGMVFTKLANPDERERQYIDALNYYMSNISLPIVFAENSNTNISSSIKFLPNKKVEILAFDGNHDKVHGKGFGEAEIIEYAINKSHYIDNDTCIIKITGRLIVKNIKGIVQLLKFDIIPSDSVICSINSDFKRANSRIVIAPCQFYRLFLNNKNLIDDNNGIYFENVLCHTITSQSKYSYFPFILEPQISGISGSLGIVYDELNHSMRYKLQYLIYRLQQQKNLTDSFHLKRLNPIRNLIICIYLSLLKMLKLIVKYK